MGTLPIQLLSTDFDGTLFAEFEQPPVPLELQSLIAQLQSFGARWVINTGRDMSSLMETLARAHLTVRPDYLVLVEREIYEHQGTRYLPVQEWNDRCRADHEALFARIRNDVPHLMAWVNERFDATVYGDPYSPFCLIAGNNGDADAILEFIRAYCESVPELTIVRNDVYARFSHSAYSKGTALTEIGRRLGISPAQTCAAGDHLNDLPMLDRAHAHFLVAPVNAIPNVKATVEQQGGYVSLQPCGLGVLDGLKHHLQGHLANQ